MTIDLIRSLYDPSCPIPNSVTYYEKAIEDIEFFGISSQVYHLLKRTEKLDMTPQFFQKRLRKVYEEGLYQNIFINNQTDLILQKLEENNIEVIPLKGVVFAKKYFGEIAARLTSDIDILIKPKDQMKVITIVRELGFTHEEEFIPNHFHRSFSKMLPGCTIPLTVEVHWDLLKRNTSNLVIDEFWAEATPYKDFKYVKELSDYHTFYMITLHGWKHNLNSLKYFIDIIQMIHYLGNQLNFNKFIKDATLHKTRNRLLRTLAVVYQQFPHLKQVQEIHLLKNNYLWWEYTSSLDFNSSSIKKYISYFHFQIFDLDAPKHRIIGFYNWLFPSKVEIEFELRDSVMNKPFINHLRLFMKRSTSLIKVIIKKNIYRKV